MRTASELTAKHWDWTIGINARGPWLLSVAAAHLMPEGGRIINLSSPGASRVLPAYFAVGVSKAAIEAVTRYLAVELGAKGISVNTVSAGFVMTDAIDAFPDEIGVREIAARPTPAGRTLTLDQVGSYVVELNVSARGFSGTPDIVTITTINTSPVAEAGPDQTVVAGNAVQLDGSASSDADGDALAFDWSFRDVPPGSGAFGNGIAKRPENNGYQVPCAPHRGSQAGRQPGSNPF